MMIQRRATAAGIRTKFSAQFSRDRHHDVRPERLKLEVAQQMAGHESARTTGLSDRRDDTVALDEVERIAY